MVLLLMVVGNFRVRAATVVLVAAVLAIASFVAESFEIALPRSSF